MPATATVRRPDPATVIHWSQRAACRDTANLHLAQIPAGYVDPHTPSARARHICLHHCPVLADCGSAARRHPPVGIVQAGLLWVDGSRGRPHRQQPTDPGCGPWCAHLTEVER